MGWLTVAMVAGGAIIGTLGGPLGTAGGAWAGFELAGAIGLGVLSTAACELTIIAIHKQVSIAWKMLKRMKPLRLRTKLCFYENIASGIFDPVLALGDGADCGCGRKIRQSNRRQGEGNVQASTIENAWEEAVPAPKFEGKSREENCRKTGTRKLKQLPNHSLWKSSKTKEGPKVSEFEQNLPSKIKNSARFRGMKEPKRSAFLRDLEADPNLLAAMEAEPKLIDVWNHVTHLVGQRGNLEFLKAFEHVLGNDKFQTHIFEGHYKVQWGVPKASGMHSVWVQIRKVRIKLSDTSV